MKHAKIWLLVLLVAIVVGQVTIISGFHYVDTYGFAQNKAVVAIIKEKYVDARVAVMINGVGTVDFSNGTQVTLSQNKVLSFTVNLPSTASRMGNGGTIIEGVNINQSQPLGAKVITNSTSLDFGFLTSFGNPGNFFSSITFVDTYWFVINGNASVTIRGYGLGL